MKYRLLVFYICLALVSFHVGPPPVTASVIVVPDNYATIQSAIDAASGGSTILVKSGTYFEHLEITKSLSINGSTDPPTILKSPWGWGGDVVRIQANNVTFARFKIEGAKESFGAGIYIHQCQHNQILDNTILGNRYGIYFWDSFDITLRNNKITNNQFNFGVWGLVVPHFLHNVDVSNVVDGKPIYYWINEKNKTIPQDAGYVALVNSTGIVVKDLNVANNFQGVLVAHSVFTKIQNITSVRNFYGIHMVASNNSVILQNNISNNNVGLLLDLSPHNHIEKNTFSNNNKGIQFSYSPLSPLRSVGNYIYKNSIIRNGDGIGIVGANCNRFCGNEIAANNRYGVIVSSSYDNIFLGNTFSTNGWGIGFEKSSNNIVYNNNFVNNTSHVYTDTSINAWNGSRAFGGNYWSNGVILDADMDAIVDVPYVISGSNIDNYPLAGAFSNFTIFWENEEYPVIVISNSSNRIFEFFPQQGKVSFNFTGPDQTLGFCRISIPKKLEHSLRQDNLTILVNGKPPSNIKKWEDNASIYAYFTYMHQNSQVSVAPEFPYVVFYAALLLILSLVTTIVVKRETLFRRHRHRKSTRQQCSQLC